MDAGASQSVPTDSRSSSLRMDKDLIIYKADYPFKVYDNRWAVSNEVTNCRALLVYTIDPRGVLPMNKAVLRRLKLYGASVEQSTAILNYLKMNNSLEQLEIDTLRLPLTHIVHPNNTFNALRVLSIDEVRLIDASGRELTGIVPNKCIGFNAPQLTNVYLGECQGCSIGSVCLIISERSIDPFSLERQMKVFNSSLQPFSSLN